MEYGIAVAKVLALFVLRKTSDILTVAYLGRSGHRTTVWERNSFIRITVFFGKKHCRISTCVDLMHN